MRERVCTVVDCKAEERVRGYCGKHYARFLRYGDPLKVSERRTPRVWAGKMIGDWEIVKLLKKGSGHCYGNVWLRRCVCGAESQINEQALRRYASQNCGCKPRVSPVQTDYAGETLGRWHVLYRVPSQRGRGVLYWCRCECGTERAVRKESLRSGASCSCGCYQRECAAKQGGSNRSAPGLAARRDIYGGYRKGAMRRNLPFLLTFVEFCSLLEQPCYYCGVEHGHSYSTTKTSGPFVGNGIDRKDNAQGYTPNNSVPCCKRCNLTKRAMSSQDFISMCQAVAAHHPVC